MAARFTSRLKSQYVPSEIRYLDRELIKVGTRILRQAVAYAPHDTGALQASGRLKREKQGHITVRFGGASSRVRYAYRRHFENRKNPQTLRYLERAGDQNIGQFIGGLR